MVVRELVGLGVACLVSGLALTYLLLYVLPFDHNKSKCVAVLVLGDLGRSPRMQNHAVALANAGWKVELIGSRGTPTHDFSLTPGADLFGDVLELKDKIHVNYLPEIPKALTTRGKALFIVFGPLKVLFQLYSLFQLLLVIPQFSYILVQVLHTMNTFNIRILHQFLQSLWLDWSAVYAPQDLSLTGIILGILFSPSDSPRVIRWYSCTAYTSNISPNAPMHIFASQT
jgi:hypothetical protein